MWLARRYRSKSISTSLVGAKSACPPSDGIGRYRAPSQNRIASPNPVPAAISAMALLAEEGAPAFKTSVSSGLRTGTPCAAASTSFSRRTVGSSKRFANSAPSTTHGKFVVLDRFSTTGPATPKQAASIRDGSSVEGETDGSDELLSGGTVAKSGTGGLRNLTRTSSSDPKSALAKVCSRAGSTRSVFQSNSA